MELCHNCPVPASCAIRGKCITDLAPVPDPRLSITADEFAAMARDAERYRWLRDGTQRLAGVGSWYRQVWTSWGDDDSLDKAIDAAMQDNK